MTRWRWSSKKVAPGPDDRALHPAYLGRKLMKVGELMRTGGETYVSTTARPFSPRSSDDEHAWSTRRDQRGRRGGKLVGFSPTATSVAIEEGC